MANAEVTKQVRAPIEAVWRFTCDMNNWAPLIIGYESHEEISPWESMWTLKGQLGQLQKAVTFKVQITEWVEPSRVAFTLQGTNDNVTGSGLFESRQTDESTVLNVQLDLKPGGLQGPMVNAMLKPVVPQVCEDFAESLAAHIEEAYHTES